MKQAWKVPKATGGLQRRRRLPARKGNETVQETLARLAPLLRQVTDEHARKPLTGPQRETGKERS